MIVIFAAMIAVLAVGVSRSLYAAKEGYTQWNRSTKSR